MGEQKQGYMPRDGKILGIVSEVKSILQRSKCISFDDRCFLGFLVSRKEKCLYKADSPYQLKKNTFHIYAFFCLSGTTFMVGQLDHTEFSPFSFFALLSLFCRVVEGKQRESFRLC